MTDVKREHNRYEAINLQNGRTVEFRIFKGTLKEATFFMSLEFVDAVVEYCAPGNHSVADMIGVEKFKAFVAENKKRWPNLHSFNTKGGE